jgi:Zn-dependent M28 family amino/carboxypeptidase
MRFPESAAVQMMEIVDWQLSFGCRYPGSRGHADLAAALAERVHALGIEPIRQGFDVRLQGQMRRCTNVVVRLRGSGDEAPLLLGTHWDTRLVGDREADTQQRGRPIPGANDGGSGTAVLLYLLGALRDLPLHREIQIAFLDAEDVGSLDGNPFSVGAAHLAHHPLGRRPAEVIALDMVGGRAMVLDRDLHALRHPPSAALTEELFRIGRNLGHDPFIRAKPDQWKYIVSDHHPFLRLGIAAALLIDIDYPPWHTQGDLPCAMEGASLAAVLEVVATYIERYLS